jgi:uncharacterized protein YbcV (DUF1398 family)
MENRARVNNRNIITQCQMCEQTTLPSMITNILNQTDYTDATVQTLQNQIAEFKCTGDPTTDTSIQSNLLNILSSMQSMYTTNTQMVTCLQQNIPSLISQIMSTNTFDDITVQSIKGQISTFQCSNSSAVNATVQTWVSNLLQAQITMQSTIVKMNTSLSSLQAQYNQIQSNLSAITMQYQNEHTKNNTCNATLTTLQAQYTTLQSNLTSLQSNMQDIQTKDSNTIATLNAQIASYVAQITSQANIQSTYACLLSVHIVFPSYTSALFLVRRASDNMTTQVTYKNGTYVLFGNPNTTLATWASNVDPFIIIWYDQSGNYRHAVQTILTLQPILSLTTNQIQFSSGSYFEIPPLVFPSNNDPYTICVKWGTISGGICGAGLPAQSQACCLRTNTPTTMVHYWWANDLLIPDYAANSILTITYDGKTQTSFFNGKQDATRTVTTPRQNQDQPAYLGRTILSNEILNGTLTFFATSPRCIDDSPRTTLENLSMI